MRRYELMIIREAETDLDEAFLWYELRKPGLGQRFILEAESAFDYIIRNPLSSEKVYFDVHRQILRVFPFSVYYWLEPKLFQIQVIGILHHKRDSKTWKKRLFV